MASPPEKTTITHVYEAGMPEFVHPCLRMDRRVTIIYVSGKGVLSERLIVPGRINFTHLGEWRLEATDGNTGEGCIFSFHSIQGFRVA